MSAYRAYVRLVGAILLIISFGVPIAAKQAAEVIIHLNDGKTIQGAVVQITKDFIKIDPEGPIMVRTIPGYKIESVEFVGSGEKLSFPLDESQIPGDLSEDPRVRQSKRSDGLRPFALTFSLGRSSAGGDYYEGIESGLGIQVGGCYRFEQDGPYGRTFFLGFSYRHSSPSLSITRIPIYGYEVSVVLENCRIHQYNFDFGTTTKVSRTDSYLYLTMGVSIVDTKITGHVEENGYVYPSETVGDSKAALRLLGGGVKGISPSLGVDVRVGYDLLVTKAERSEYSYYGSSDGPDVLGNILSIDVGVIWEP